MLRDKISKYLRENGIRVNRLDVIDERSLVYYLSKNDAAKIQRSLFTHQLDLDALISDAPERGANALRFEKTKFK